MKVLQICHKTPFPPNDGGTIATYQLTKAMIQMGWTVKILSITTNKHPKTELPLDPVYKATNPEFINVKTTPSIYGLLKSLWSNNNYIVTRFLNDDFSSLISSALNADNYDLIIFESIFTALYFDLIKRKSKAKLILRSHNVEFQLWEDRLLNESNFVKHQLLKQPVKQLKKFEIEQSKKFNYIASISINDKAFFNSYIGLKKSIYVPFGISLPDEIVVDDQANDTIIFLGALDWEPNINGIKWFLNEVWPIVYSNNSNIKFIIGGRNAPSNFGSGLPKGVNFIGTVEDAHSFISGGKIMVVPLFESSGIRIKIIEGLALGQVICTTTKGNQGIPSQNGKDIIIADSAKQMARKIIDTLKSNKTLTSISKNARILAKKEFDISNTQKALLNLVNSSRK